MDSRQADMQAPEDFNADWDDSATLVWFDEPDSEERTWATLDRWWPEGTLLPEIAWVANHFDRRVPGAWKLTKTRVDAPAVPGHDEGTRRLVVVQARAAIGAGPPPAPPAVRFGDPTNTTSGFLALVRHVGEGLMRAEGRVFSATETKTDDAELRIAVYETMAWLRTLDEVFERAWSGVALNRREAVSQRVDQAVLQLQGSGSSLGIFNDAFATRRQTGKPYEDWALALFRGNVTRNELLGFRWLAGKLLHHGPRRCTELVQWVAGAEPRWKWVPADLVVPEAGTEPKKLWRQREAYETSVQGRDVSGMMGFDEIVLEGEYFFRTLYADEWEPSSLRG